MSGPVLVTGAAGFIGFHACRALLARGERVIGVDSLTDYYDPRLKLARLAVLEGTPGFAFHRLDIADPAALKELAGRHPDLERVVHLAAQPGVRRSLTEPFAYAHANLVGHLAMLELARGLGRCAHFVYASSSSVYGANRELPFRVEDPADRPVSLYGATKKAAEGMSYSYSHLFGLPVTGLRFFTVYGPWGRPDMAVWLFTAAILEGRPITLFNAGAMRRDFTYVDDIVAGTLAVLDHPPADASPPARVYNIGNHRAEPLDRLVAAIEAATGRAAIVAHAPMQPGDVLETYADIEPIRRDCGFEPTTNLDQGIARFVAWYDAYRRV